jgi:hypothetical protein
LAEKVAQEEDILQDFKQAGKLKEWMNRLRLSALAALQSNTVPWL